MRESGGPPKIEAGHRGIHSHYRDADWNDWLAGTGQQAAADGAERMSFSTSLLTWQAAIDGLGMAIGQTAMLSSEFERGALVWPFDQPVRRSMALAAAVRP